MSARTEKAHQALADACEEYEQSRKDSPTKERDHLDKMSFLLDVANIQAQLAQAEAMESIAEHYAWQRRTNPLGVQQIPGVQVTPYTQQPYQSPPFSPRLPPTWAERTGLDHVRGIGSNTVPDIEGRDVVANGETQH